VNGFPRSGIVAILAASAFAGASEIDWDSAASHWAFTPPREQTPPTVRDAAWPRERVDFFVLARLEAAGLEPSPELGRRALIRRLSFDLTGLPPTPAEVERFLADERPGTVERLVDELLARPAFGERMASFWLNLARYAEDQAHQVGDKTFHHYPNAWRYREWVVDAFNADLPYDEFVRKQLAADLEEPAAEDDLPALGFLGLGHKLYSRKKLEVQMEEWSDQVDTVSQTFLGLTVACARCHDHKDDPISIEDYHAMAGVFASIEMVNRRPDGSREEAKTEAKDMHPKTLHVVAEGEPRDLPVFPEGGEEEVPRGFLSLLGPGRERVEFSRGSGRAELVGEIVAESNPLTARVYVNRLWGLLTGRAIAPNPSNLGVTGMAPTHPQLLDDLAVRFVRDGWSTKRLVREIVLSATYRQDSARRSEAVAIDEENRLFWRMERRRLPVEMLRDAMLQASGRLERGGGASRDLDDPEHVKRTLYSSISRLTPDKMLCLFDYPDANVHVEDRNTSTTPMQKLFLMNGDFVLREARALAERLEREFPDDEEARVGRAFQLLFARDPSAGERRLVRDFLEEAGEVEGFDRWDQFAHGLLVSNEMFHVD